MFSAPQLAYLRSLASQSAGGVRISYTKTRLLLQLARSDGEYENLIIAGWFVGALLLFFLVAGLIGKGWLFCGIGLCGLGAVGWGIRWLLQRRAQNLDKPAALVFDLPGRCFYVLEVPTPAAPITRYARYPAAALTASRVVVLSSTEYHDDVVVELAFGGDWVRVLRLTSSPLAYELEQALRWCQAQS